MPAVKALTSDHTLTKATIEAGMASTSDNTATAGLSVQNDVNLSRRLPAQLLESILVPGAVIIVLSVIVCIAWCCLEKRQQNKTSLLPLFKGKQPGKEVEDPDISLAELTDESIERYEGRKTLTTPSAAHTAF